MELNLRRDIYPRIAVDQLWGEVKEKADYFIAKCPGCGKYEAYIYKANGTNGLQLNCNRLDECAFSISAWEQIAQNNGLNPDIDKGAIYKKLAEMAGYDLTDSRYSYDPEKESKKESKAALMDKFYQWSKDLLFSKQEAKETLEYLRRRGYTDEIIKKMGLGYFPNNDEIKNYLSECGFKDSEIDSSGLINYKQDGIQAKDNKGKIYTVMIPDRENVGVVVRTIYPEKDLPEGLQKYRYSFGMTLDYPSNISNARKSNPLIVVEGFLDCNLARAMGLENVASTGTNSLNDKQIKNLEILSFKQVIINFDTDKKAGREGTAKTIEKIYRSTSIKPFVLRIPESLGCKDPDEVITKYGIEKYRELLNNVVPGSVWLAREHVVEFNLSNPGEKEKAIQKAYEFDSSLPAEKARHCKEYIEEIAKLVNEPIEIILAEFEPIKAKKEKDRLEREYRHLLTTGNKYLQEKKLNAFENLFKTNLIKIKSESIDEEINYFDFDEFLEKAKQISLKGKDTGFRRLNKLSPIIPTELVIVGARPRHGKSSFAYNLFLNFIENYPNEPFIFFSHEIPETILMARLATIWAKKHKNISLEYKEIMKCYRKGLFSKEILDAFNTFKKFGLEQRMITVHKPEYTVDQIRAYSNRVADRHGVIGAIFVDYIELVKTNKKETEELRIADITNNLCITAKELNTPVIALAQMNRASVKDKKLIKRRPTLESLRYSGRQEQEASTVLGLFNLVKEQDTIDETPIEDRIKESDFEIIILKNRGGATGITKGRFDMQSGYMYEESSSKVENSKNEKSRNDCWNNY